MRCTACGATLSGLDAERGMCSLHPQAHGDDWHVANRILCDFLHRKVELARLPLAAREEPAYGDGEVA